MVDDHGRQGGGGVEEAAVDHQDINLQTKIRPVFLTVNNAPDESEANRVNL